MNKYPLWRYLLILAIILPGLIYALPNLYGDDPAIQISATRANKVNVETLARVEQALKQANLAYTPGELDEKGYQGPLRRYRYSDQGARPGPDGTG